MIAATVTATAVARYIDGYSIYSARLRARPSQPGPAPAPASPGRAVGAAPEPEPPGPQAGQEAGPQADSAVAQHGPPRPGPARPRQRAGGAARGRLGRRN
jgi:hypothetical protein